LKLIMYMDALLASRERSGQQVRLEYVRGHAGEMGNEGADALAVRGTRLQEVEEPDWDALRFGLDEERVTARGAKAVAADREPVDADISVSHS
jgi:RNase H